MSENVPSYKPMTLFILVRALPAWLQLSREKRQQIARQSAPQNKVSIRQFDCEAFSAICSDIWMVTAGSAAELNTVMERLRDTPLFAHPYFAFVAILPAIEDGWKAYNESEVQHG